MKTIYTALLVVSFAAIVMVGSASAVGVTYGDDELMLGEYGHEWGPASVTKNNVAGEGVMRVRLSNPFLHQPFPFDIRITPVI